MRPQWLHTPLYLLEDHGPVVDALDQKTSVGWGYVLGLEGDMDSVVDADVMCEFALATFHIALTWS